jgi:hypothetical protein
LTRLEGEEMYISRSILEDRGAVKTTSGVYGEIGKIHLHIVPNYDDSAALKTHVRVPTERPGEAS